jgi:transposase-like protein
MQKRYTEEFKESVVKQMMPPNPASIAQLVKESGVSDVTLYKWGKIIEICNQEEFRSQSPKQIVPALADQGIYLASESSF